MSVLSAIQLTLADDEAEKKFLAAFTKALEYTGEIKGLIGLTAWKQVGVERTYMAFTEWEDEESIEAWLQGEKEQRNIAMAKGHLCASTGSSRWQLIRKSAWAK
jgi:heme-degrading monooxygenase HmoA